MATTVNNAFEEFNRDIVNLDSDRTKAARTSRDWLISQLSSLDTKEDLNFPYEYLVKHIKYGSFARNTKIRELDDIDLMFCLTGDNATYTQNGSVYTIYTTNAGIRLKNLSDNNILNSRKVVNKFVSSLSEIEHYKKADIHRRGEAATLNLTSYEWTFDIVPCFYTDTQLYLIPDGNGNWKATNPQKDQDYTINTNNNYNGKALQLIRTLKHWNCRKTKISSYLFEQIVLNYINTCTKLEWIDFDIRDFFSYLSLKIYSDVTDPKGIQGNLNDISYYERINISSTATASYNIAVNAVKAEIDEKDQKKSIGLWKDIFGDKFPMYG